jgi:hypothetical protein
VALPVSRLYGRVKLAIRGVCSKIDDRRPQRGFGLSETDPERTIAGPHGQEPALAKAQELRLAGVSSITAANARFAGFIAAYNWRFGREQAKGKSLPLRRHAKAGDLHRRLSPADDLDEILAWREERTVTRNLTLHYDRMILLLDPTPLTHGLVGKKVEVVNYLDGRFAVQSNGTALGFKVFDKVRTVQPGAIVDNKQLSAVLEQLKAQQAAYPAHQQRGHTARRRPANDLEAPGFPSKGTAPRRAVVAAPA